MLHHPGHGREGWVTFGGPFFFCGWWLGVTRTSKTTPLLLPYRKFSSCIYIYIILRHGPEPAMMEWRATTTAHTDSSAPKPSPKIFMPRFERYIKSRSPVRRVVKNPAMETEAYHNIPPNRSLGHVCALPPGPQRAPAVRVGGNISCTSITKVSVQDPYVALTVIGWLSCTSMTEAPIRDPYVALTCDSLAVVRVLVTYESV